MEFITNRLKRSSYYITAIVFYLICGLLLLIWPSLAIQIANTALGVLLCAIGLLLIIVYFKDTLLISITNINLTLGLCAVGLGAFVLIVPGFLSQLLPFLWGVSLLIGGFGKVQISLDLLRMKDKYWWIGLIAAVISITLGVIACINSDDIAKSLTMFIGISLLVEAALDIVTEVSINKRIRIFRKNMEQKLVEK